MDERHSEFPQETQGRNSRTLLLAPGGQLVYEELARIVMLEDSMELLLVALR
jgi:hypothetical protein